MRRKPPDRAHPAYVDRAAQLVAGLPFPTPFTVERFVDGVAQMRRRPIKLVTFEAVDDVLTGAALRTEQADYIHYRADLTGFHRDQVICHELGHILADHVDQPSAPARLASLSLLAGDAARHMFARACVAGDDREDEAEYIASLILQRARETNTGPVARGLAAALD